MATAYRQLMTETAADSFEAFYDEWFDRVYNYARHRTGSATRADEIVSDTFTRVLDAWPRFDPEKGDRRTWLFSIAFRAVADHYRSETRRRWFDLGGIIGSRAEAEPEPPPDTDDERRRLLEALAKLTDQQRELVSLKFFSGMTNRAIAGVTGLSEANVGVILFRSVRRMRQDLEGTEEGHG